MSVHEFYGALGVDVPNRPGAWVDIPCFLPDHDDERPSCGVNTDHGGFRCQACGGHGGAYDAAVALGRQPRDAAELCKRHGLGHWNEGGQGGDGVSNRATAQQHPANPQSRAENELHDAAQPSAQPAAAGCSLEQYAEHKRLPVDFLRGVGVSDYKDNRWPGVRVLRVPYRTPDGSEPAVRIRHSLHKPTAGDRFLWRKGSKPVLYGLDRLDAARSEGYVVLVEGESDCHTLWHHDVPALGLPGASGWKEHRDAAHLEGVGRVFVVVEPDAGGDAVLGWVSRSAVKDRAWLVELNGHKDPSGLHVDDPARFRERWQGALDRAEPWRERAAQLEDADRRDAYAACERLARRPRILDDLADEAGRAGVTGERDTVQLVYLAATSRLLDRLTSLIIKGQSASGKSWVVQTVLRFFPDTAYYALTAASEHALIYDDEPLAHRVLVIYEASGMASETFSYIVRSLLSEGKLRYPTVVKRDGELTTVMIEREGPTNLITTTTALQVHPENETRMLSLASDDSKDQTRNVLLALADEDGDTVDFDQWHALQRWLELGPRAVSVPYATTLAEQAVPAVTRLRRDFGSVLSLIRAHALLHQGSRARDARGRVVADLDDYAIVWELVKGVVAEAAEKTVKRKVREVVEAVAAHGGEQVTQATLAEELKVDKGTVSRNVRAALKGGYLENKEERRGRPHKLVANEPLPADEQILPSPDKVREALARGVEHGAVAGVAHGVAHADATPNPRGRAENEGELHGCTVDGPPRTPPPPSESAEDRINRILGDDT